MTLLVKASKVNETNHQKFYLIISAFKTMGTTIKIMNKYKHLLLGINKIIIIDILVGMNDRYILTIMSLSMILCDVSCIPLHEWLSSEPNRHII